MDMVLASLSVQLFFAACVVAFVAGTVKGIVGFAMPILMISGMSTFIAPDLALAGLILPTLVTNIYQAGRQGPREAWRTIVQFRIFLIAGGITLALGAQLVVVLERELMFIVIGAPVLLFVSLQLLGWRPRLQRRSTPVDTAVGAIAGLSGGMFGVWGPPTILYLTALDIPKIEHVRVQGVVYGLGSVLLVVAHIKSGILNWDTAPFSLALIIPATLGMAVGLKVHDRFDQQTFRKVTMIVLLIAAANLLRRGIMG